MLLVWLVASGCGSAGGEGEPASAERSAARVLTAASSPKAPAPRVRARRGETLAARVVRPTPVRADPSAAARAAFTARPRTPFGSQTVLAVMERRGPWLGVSSEELPNGELGWVREDRVELLRELWSIAVDLSERRATLRLRGRPFRSFPVAVGAPATPTPPGRYGVTDRLTTGGEPSPYGCCVLAISGRQPNVPQGWPGGDRLAIHGTSAPASIGSAASSGCLRAREASMRLLMRRVPLGARVVVRR